MHPHPDPELVDKLARIIHNTQAGATHAEWSQVSTGHAGRIHYPDGRLPLPVEAVEVFQQLRETMRSPEQGVWFSARINLDEDPTFTPNYTERVFWNSPSLLTPPDEDPIPTAAQCLAEMRRNPREPEFHPPWLAPRVDDSGEFTRLRQALTEHGVPQGLVRLPGEQHLTFEGAVLVRALESMYSIDVFDYGQLHHVDTETSARAAGAVAWSYLTAPLPQPVVMAAEEVESRARGAEDAYRRLSAQIAAAGPGGVQIGLATGVPYDRWGGVDGLYMFAWNTPHELRSLPPSATDDGARRVALIANEPLEVQAEHAPAWFDQPGGGIRFRTPEPIRDLVHRGVLSLITQTHHVTTPPAAGG